MRRILHSFLLTLITISALAQAPAGYYNSATGTGATLKTQLKNIISTGHNPGSYAGLWTAYQSTDRDYYYENDGSVLDIYSENPTTTDPYNFSYPGGQCSGTNGPEGYCYNREHIVPQSLFSSALPMYSDVHFIRATDAKVNGERGNFPFGKVGTASFTSLNGSKKGNSISPGYSGTVFEPIDEFKGDVARMIFYFVTRYETQLSTFNSGNMLGNSAYPGLQTWELDQLIAWHNADPVSAAEIGRNNASFAYQGNRNPYIDNSTYVNSVWGTPTTDTQAPTVPTNLVANNPTSSTVTLNWIASTDNVGVTGYDVYANGVLKATVTTTSTTVQNLASSTTYNFYVVAKDAAGNLSGQSNTATETTLAGSGGGAGTSCGTEDFSNIPATSSSYSTRTWTNNNITWTATDARTDQTINGKAITIQNGSLTSSSISGGIQTLTVTTQRKFGGTASALDLEVNGTVVTTIPYNENVTTTTVNVNISGNVVIKLINPVASNRVAIDDLSWTCATLSTVENSKDRALFSVYPNPVKNHELFVKGENLNKVSKAAIYDLSGKLIKTIANPFKNSNKIDLHGLTKGVYILKTDNNSTKFIVD